ncbi:transmembrane transport protein [Dactylosporangium siamense]|uniref:Transporter n=1 Tax=Dactylosporangium siamense TaxID=685454 RepID=A0A919PZP5_9ACTN|nr:transmembrane transport protein [Dactylosporangium siamense]GIG52607.1 transporter [Dactylosporangium siamense]
MTWLTWRQFRVQALAAAGAVAVLALYIIHLRDSIGAFIDARIVGCAGEACSIARMELRGDYEGQLAVVLGSLLLAPALIGIFWGAPLVARELEERTDRLVWNQSVTRTRWLAVKLAVVGLVAALVTGLLSLALTWSLSRYDALMGQRFAAFNFDTRNVVPIGYALFASVLGTVVGMLTRRTLTAMAITLVAFTALQVLVPAVVRQHLLPPVTQTVIIDADVLSREIGLSLGNDNLFTVHGYTVPGGWALSDGAPVFKADGTRYTGEDDRPCIANISDRAAVKACMVAKHLHFEHTYQPGNRYWTFQWIELALYTALAALLAGFGFVWLRRSR